MKRRRRSSVCVLSSKSCCIQPIEDTNVCDGIERMDEDNALEEECVVGAELKVIEKSTLSSAVCLRGGEHCACTEDTDKLCFCEAREVTQC